MEILNILNEHYPLRFDKYEHLRDGGSTSYAVFSGGIKYFLRVIKPAFFDTAVKGVEVQVFLQSKDFSVPHVIHAIDELPYVRTTDELYVLYEFVEGSEVDPEQDAEAIGALIGNLHKTMDDYPNEFILRDKHFYIGRYIDILRNKNYPRTEEFFNYGEQLWDKIKDLPHGFCHGDMYSGNIHKTPDGRLFLLDFDTSSEGFPMYDPALICNMTHYFDFDENGYGKSKEVFSRFLIEYLKYNTLSQKEIGAFFHMIALYHFALQATIIEIHGLDCVDNAFLDKQLEWLYRWRKQCENEVRI